METVSAASVTLETSAVASANKATLAGGTVSMLGGLTASDIGVFAGVLIGVIGLAISWFFKHRADKRYEDANERYEEAHAAYMKRIGEITELGAPPVLEKADPP